MNDFKATLEQWKKVKGWASVLSPMSADSACILELQARIELLEAQARNYPEIPDSSTPPPVATDEELKQTWLQGATLTQGNRAVYNLGVAHGQARSREVADPAPVAGGLMARVVYAICRSNPAEIDWYPEARAAILEVAKWLREQGWENAANLLEEEAGR
jgi:hypothetical protein